MCSMFAMINDSAAKSLNLVAPSILAPIVTASLLVFSDNQSIQTHTSTVSVSVPTVFCHDGTEGPTLIPDQCMEALVNSDFARLPPTEMLTLAPRSSNLPVGQIGLPRRYSSCM